MVRIAAFFIAIAALASAACCPRADAVTVRDAGGKEIEIATPVKRVVFLSLYELIPVFDVWDSVVGLNRWAYDSEVLKGFPRMKEIPSVGTADSVNVEALLALRPDLVITWSYKPEVAEFLIRKGLAVISVYPESLDELYAILDMCGTLFQKEERAAEIKLLMRETCARLEAKASEIPPEKRRKVLWLWQKPTTVSGGVGLQQDLIRLIGALNPAGAIRAKHPEVSMESIVAWNPDVIFIWGNARYGPKDILAGSRWKAVKAVREGRVYKAPTLSNWSPAITGMALWMAWKTYPEYFDRGALEDMARQSRQRCFGVPFDGFAFD
ncbi:MAG: ABC transporter substrate-binding protein [Desulfobacteraceae bacterium]|nr:ABC transporter substrate-binding protein [Desulfobacteraceae bacterium]